MTEDVDELIAACEQKELYSYEFFYHQADEIAAALTRLQERVRVLEAAQAPALPDEAVKTLRRKIVEAIDDGAYEAMSRDDAFNLANTILALLPASALPDGWDDAALLQLAEAFNENRELDDVGMSRQDIIAAMRSAMLAARPAAPTGWRDIATAPKDGTPVLIVAASPLFSEGRVYLAWWATPYEAAPDEQCFWRAYSALGNATSTIPPEWATHWMPLPAAPTEEGR